METQHSIEPIQITLSDGKERGLRYDLATLRRLKKKFGRSLISAGGLQNLDEDSLPELIAEGLVGEKLTGDQVAELIDARMIPYVAQKFGEAFTASNGESKAPDPPPAVPVSTLPN